MKKSVKVQVTATDIRKGVPNEAESCAVARACKRALGLKMDSNRVEVDSGMIFVDGVDDDCYWTMSMPKKVEKFVDAYDKRLPVKPLTSPSSCAMSRGFAAIGLHCPSKEVNVGGALRAAHCYDAKLIVVAGGIFKRHPSDTTSAYRHTPLVVVDDIFDAIPFDCVPVAIELTDDARSLVDYVHPESAYYIFGPESGSIPGRILERCRDVVKVPTRQCMNLAATVNVVLYDRLAKRG